MVGMFFGAAVYAEVYPFLRDTILARGDFGKLTLVDVTGLSPTVILGALAVVTIGLFLAIEFWERRGRPAAPKDDSSPSSVAGAKA